MWAGNQASGLIGRLTDKLWGKEREVVACIIMYSFIPHSDNIHSMLGFIHSWQSTRGLFTLFIKKSLCFSKPVKVLICVLTGLFRRWLLVGLWRCASTCIWASALFVYVFSPAEIDVCWDWEFCNMVYFGLWVVWLIGQCSSCILKRCVFWSTPILN